MADGQNIPKSSSAAARLAIKRKSAAPSASQSCRCPCYERAYPMSADFTLAELAIAAASEAWRGSGEVLATGIGIVPRLAASLAKLTHSPELLLNDGEAYLVEEPVPLGPRGD